MDFLNWLLVAVFAVSLTKAPQLKIHIPINYSAFHSQGDHLCGQSFAMKSNRITGGSCAMSCNMDTKNCEIFTVGIVTHMGHSEVYFHYNAHLEGASSPRNPVFSPPCPPAKNNHFGNSFVSGRQDGYFPDCAVGKVKGDFYSKVKPWHLGELNVSSYSLQYIPYRGENVSKIGCGSGRTHGYIEHIISSWSQGDPFKFVVCPYDDNKGPFAREEDYGATVFSVEHSLLYGQIEGIYRTNPNCAVVFTFSAMREMYRLTDGRDYIGSCWSPLLRKPFKGKPVSL